MYEEPQNLRHEAGLSGFELRPFLKSQGCACLLAICLLVGGCKWFLHKAQAHDVIATLECGKNRQVVILAEYGWLDSGNQVYYEIRIGGDTLVPTTSVQMVYEPLSELKFDVRFAANRDIVGIVVQSDSVSDFWVVHDFRDGASWPRGDSDPKFRGSGKFTREDLEDLLRNQSPLKPENK